MLSKIELQEFEEDISNCFINKQIKAPIHLERNNEDQLIEIFKDIRKQDWVLTTWRSHYKCLLKGVPKEELKQAILNGRSINLCFPEYKILSSAIVGGNIPIGVGIAKAIKLKNRDSKVYVFIGDMTAETGIFWESIKYVIGHDLPIKFIIEDNGKSVCTPTRNTWVNNNTEDLVVSLPIKYVDGYSYDLPCPHAGPLSGERIQF
jgi:pyruvate dehydrogenase E1 component alpha subunit